MLWVPPPNLTKRWTSIAGGNPAVNPGISFATGGSAHNKTTWQELSSGLAFDLYKFRLIVSGVGANGVSSAALIDIGLGAASSEQVLIPDWVIGGMATQFGATPSPCCVEFPIFIPASTRISCRAQCSSNRTIYVVAEGDGDCSRPSSLWAARRVVAYGPNTGDSSAVAVLAGGSAAEGSWTEITAATTEDHSALMVACGLDTGDTSYNGASPGYVDLAIGAGGSEELIAENLILTWSSFETHSGFFQNPIIWRHIPSGTRVAARISSSGAADTVTIGVYGLS